MGTSMPYLQLLASLEKGQPITGDAGISRAKMVSAIAMVSWKGAGFTGRFMGKKVLGKVLETNMGWVQS